MCGSSDLLSVFDQKPNRQQQAKKTRQEEGAETEEEGEQMHYRSRRRKSASKHTCLGSSSHKAQGQQRALGRHRQSQGWWEGAGAAPQSPAHAAPAVSAVHAVLLETQLKPEHELLALDCSSKSHMMDKIQVYITISSTHAANWAQCFSLLLLP